MIAGTLVFAVLLLLFAIPLAAAFGPDDLATLRRWRQRWRVHRYATAWHRDGVDLLFRFDQLARIPARQRLAGGARS